MVEGTLYPGTPNDKGANSESGKTVSLSIISIFVSHPSNLISLKRKKKYFQDEILSGFHVGLHRC